MGPFRRSNGALEGLTGPWRNWDVDGGLDVALGGLD